LQFVSSSIVPRLVMNEALLVPQKPTI
jgi:hypothetical protein